LASWRGHAEIVETLLEAGADVNAINPAGDTPLIEASNRGHTEIVERLLAKEEINVNMHNNAGDTALHNASRNGHTEIVAKLLLKPSILVDERGGNGGKTSLIWASIYAHKEIIERLLAARADINTTDNNNNTALRWANLQTQPDWHGNTVDEHTEIVELLIRKGAEIRDSDYQPENLQNLKNIKERIRKERIRNQEQRMVPEITATMRRTMPRTIGNRIDGHLSQRIGRYIGGKRKTRRSRHT